MDTLDLTILPMMVPMIKEPTYFHNGIPVPRVTEIISKTIHEDYIVQWANHLGFKFIKYQDELDKYADRGAYAHKCIEEYLLNNIIIDPDNVYFKNFMNWYEYLGQHETEIIASEKALTCELFGGTLDMLMRVDGKFYLVDFKTTSKVTYKQFIQLSAYRRMLQEIGYNIDGVIILQLGYTGFGEYLIDLSNPIHREFIDRCTMTFCSMVYTYYMIHDLEQRFKTIF